MRPAVASVLAGVATLAGIGGAALTLHARDTHYPLPSVNDRFLYLQSGKTADRLALSFDSLVADIYWVRTIQHYGRDYKNRNRPGRFELLEPLLDLTTTLDPHFLIAYRFGAVFLALSPPDGPGTPERAIALLEKGLAANPDKWQLPYDIAFTHYLHTGNYRAAVEWFQKAEVMPGAPPWIGQLAAATAAQGGDRRGARQMLLELRNADEDFVRRAAERTLIQLDALDAIDGLNRLIDEYRARTGRDASGWHDLVAAGMLQGIPGDPGRTPYLFDAQKQRAALSPESPLMPLPPMLAPK